MPEKMRGGAEGILSFDDDEVDFEDDFEAEEGTGAADWENERAVSPNRRAEVRNLVCADRNRAAKSDMVKKP